MNKQLSYCLETARRETLSNIAEMDVEMTIWTENDLQMSFNFKVVKSGTNRKLVYIS